MKVDRPYYTHNTDGRKGGLTITIIDNGCVRPGNVIKERERHFTEVKELPRKTEES